MNPAWYVLDKFTVEQASYLLADLEPGQGSTEATNLNYHLLLEKFVTPRLATGVIITEVNPGLVGPRYKRIPHLRAAEPEDLIVTRSELETLAKSMRIKPKFLFEEKGLHLREKQNLQEIIRALCRKLGINPDDREASSEVKTICELSGFCPDIKTIRKALKREQK